MNDANDHTLNLYVEDNTFKILDTATANSSFSFVGWVLGGIFLIIMALMAISNMFKPEKIVFRPIR